MASSLVSFRSNVQEAGLVKFQHSDFEILNGFITCYEASEDILSRRLIAWIKIVPFCNNPTDLSSHIHYLATRILNNPFDIKTLLLEPVLDGDWVWERMTLGHYKGSGERSPFTREFILERPHTFAQQFLELLHTWIDFGPLQACQRVSLNTIRQWAPSVMHMQKRLLETELNNLLAKETEREIDLAAVCAKEREKLHEARINAALAAAKAEQQALFEAEKAKQQTEAAKLSEMERDLAAQRKTAALLKEDSRKMSAYFDSRTLAVMKLEGRIRELS